MNFLIALVSLLLSTVTAQAQYRYKTAVSGKPLMIEFVGTINPDCTSAGDTTVRVIQSPQNGRVHITKSRNFLAYAASNSRSACNRRRVPGTAIHYTSNSGYLGSDYVTLEAISPTGEEGRRSYSITVK